MIFLSVFTFGFLIYAYICNIYFKQYYNNICDFQLYEDISTDEDEDELEDVSNLKEDTDEDVPELEDVSNLKEDTDENVSNLKEDTDENVSNLKEDGVPELIDISKNESSNNKNVLDTEVLEEEELTEEGDYLLYKRKREYVHTNENYKIRKSRSF